MRRIIYLGGIGGGLKRSINGWQTLTGLRNMTFYNAVQQSRGMVEAARINPEIRQNA